VKRRFLFAFLVPLLAGCSAFAPCENVVSLSSKSPNGVHQVVVFTRSCGATTSDSTQVSLLPSGKNIGDENGNVVVCGDEESVKVHWKSGSTVVISPIGTSKIFKKESLVDGIHIHYN